MGAIRITAFGGVQPRVSERLLPDTSAQVAANCRLTDGELVPIYLSKSVYVSGKTGAQVSIHRIVDGVDSLWLTWPYDVDVVKTALQGEQKWVFTGDGEPRITTYAMASGSGTSHPNTFYALGVPQPTTAPTVSPTGGTGADVSRVYVYTFFTAWGEESAPSPASSLATGKVDGTWAISAMDAVPANSGTVTGVFAAGVTTFNNTTNHWLRTGDEVVVASTTLVATRVSATQFSVPGNYSAATSWARKAPWNTAGMKRRLYRSAGTTATYQLVHDDVSTTYSDTLSDSAIMGDELISDGWLPPPTGLKGVFSLPSGALCGFVGNVLHFSEPHQPHAWVADYELQTQYVIVSAASFGTGIGVGTEAWPAIVTGVDPGQMSLTDWPEALPCSSKRSLVSVGDFVGFSSPMGLIALSSSGAQVWSLRYFTDIEWGALNPPSMRSAFTGRKLYVYYTDAYNNSAALVFNLAGDTTNMFSVDIYADALYADTTTGKLYHSIGQNVMEYDSHDQYYAVLDWMSKEFVLPKPINLGAAKVQYDTVFDEAQVALIEAEAAAIVAANAALVAANGVHSSWGRNTYASMVWGGSQIVTPPSVPPANEVSFSLYTDGKLKFSKVISSSSAFRLPSGYKSDRVAVRVVSQCPISSIVIGDTMKSLENA